METYRPTIPLPVVGSDDRTTLDSHAKALTPEEACALYLAQFAEGSCVGTILTATVESVYTTRRTGPHAPEEDAWVVRESGPCRCGCDEANED